MDTWPRNIESMKEDADKLLKGKTEVNYNAYVSFEKLGSELNLLNTQEYVEYQYE